MSLLIVPLLYPDLAGLLNFSHLFQHNFRVADYSPNDVFRLPTRRSLVQRTACAAFVGLMLWFMRKKFVGSYLSFKEASRS